MNPLVVNVADVEAGTAEQFAFIRSPVRIGRGKLNDLRLLRPFVSSYHGLVQFDDQEARYLDLGSMNGSLLGGVRLAPNTAAVLAAGSELLIGTLRLTFARHPAAARPADATRVSGAQRAPSQPSPPAPPERPEPVVEEARAQPRPSDAEPPSAEPGAGEGRRAVRAVRLLETFARCFLRLRREHDRFGSEMGIPTVRGEGSLCRARDAAQLLGYLLDPDAEGREQELERAFEDLVLHDLALVGAVVEGAHAFVERWDASERTRHDGADDDEQIVALLFGKEFERAYAAIARGRAVQPDDAEGERRPAGGTARR